VPKYVALAVQKQFYFVWGRSPSGSRLKFGANPYPFTPGAAGPPTPKSFPQFLKIVRVRVKISIALYGDPKGHM